jgi:hypothetical protein
LADKYHGAKARWVSFLNSEIFIEIWKLKTLPPASEAIVVWANDLAP